MIKNLTAIQLLSAQKLLAKLEDNKAAFLREQEKYRKLAIKLQQESIELEDKFKKELKLSNDMKFNWLTLDFRKNLETPTNVNKHSDPKKHTH